MSKRMKLSAFWKKKVLPLLEKTILDSNNVKAAAESLMAEVDMVFVPTDNIISSNPWKQSTQVSIKHKVPVFGGSTEMIAVGGLYNYGTNYEELDVRQQECWFVS